MPSKAIVGLDAASAYEIQREFVAPVHPHPSQPGKYVADYGAFGQITFDVV